MSLTIGSGQTTVLSSSVSGIDVSDGATLEVVGGGIANDGTVSAGGSVTVQSGGLVSSSVFSSEIVGSSPIVSGGVLIVSAGGTAIDTTLGFAAAETVMSGGIDLGAAVNGGHFDVLAGGSAIDTDAVGGAAIISSGGTEVLASGGAATGVSLLSGAVFSAAPGANIAMFTVDSGFVLSVTSGMQAALTDIESGGAEVVAHGGFATYGQVYAGGTMTVAEGGSAFAPTLTGSKTFSLGSGGSLIYSTMTARLEVSSGGRVGNATLDAGAVATVSYGGQDSGSTIGSGGLLVVEAGGSAGAETIGPAGVLQLRAGASLSEPISFAPAASGGELVVAGTGLPNVVISGFDAAGVSQGDTIDLAGVAFTSTVSTTFSDSSGVLTVEDGGAIHELDLVDFPTVPGERFAVASDGQGGTNVFAVACFAAGTRLAMPHAWIEVERLVPGDLLRLADGRTAPVVWLGHRRIDCARHPSPDSVQPVRILPHAFGLGRPNRTLRLSPDHAVFVDGVLIPIRYLLNGSTVAQEAARRVSYFHVQLPAHGVLLAEGLPAESYLDTGNRACFANGGTVVLAYPDFARGVWARSGCAPVVTDGPAFDLVYRKLIAQALALGWRPQPTRQPGRVIWRAPLRRRQPALRTA